MDFVCGNAKDAYALKNVLLLTVSGVAASCNELSRSGQQVRDAWQDQGGAVVDEMVSDITRALAAASDSVENVAVALDQYAKFLEEK